MATVSLAEFLDAKDPRESNNGNELRKSILTELVAIFRHIVQSKNPAASGLQQASESESDCSGDDDDEDVGGNKELERENDDAGGIILTFGSYELGIHSQDSDMDAVCIGPKFLSRHSFFVEMAEALKTRDEVSDLVVIDDAHVPLLGFKFSGVEFDLAYAKLSLDFIPKDFARTLLSPTSSQYFKDMDERCVRSLNGVRMAHEIRSLIPVENLAVFQVATRAFKYWAKQRGIYSSLYGFLGGVACVVVVAKTCQQKVLVSGVNSGSADSFDVLCMSVLQKTFGILYSWAWNGSPFNLTEIKVIQNDEDPSKDFNGRPYTMAILTPTQPSVCCTSTVTASSLAVMMKEFKRGTKKMAEMVKSAQSGKSTVERWEDLMEPVNIFQKYKFFVKVVASSGTKEGFLAWAGLIQAKLPRLIARLEATENIQIVHPVIKGFDNLVHPKSPELEPVNDAPTISTTQEPAKAKPFATKTFFIGLQFCLGTQTINLSAPGAEFTQSVKNTREFLDGALLDVVVSVVKRSEIPEQLMIEGTFGLSIAELDVAVGGGRTKSRDFLAATREISKLASEQQAPII
ncbi:Poly(A) polymerase central domain-containing protein [Obelidium mucronatum]|nr:Poly(A) polymerase central domain-containing protein [Obelidium mucronatum]